MLEAMTIQKLNELLQVVTENCIELHEINELVTTEKLNALANLISAVNIPSDPPLEHSPVIGFVIPSECDGDEDEE